MDKLGGFTSKKLIIAIAALVVAGGIMLGLTSTPGVEMAPAAGVAPGYQNYIFGAATGQAPTSGPGPTLVIGSTGTTYTTETTVTSVTTTETGQTPAGPNSTTTQGAPASNGGLIEFSSEVTIESASPQQAASQVSALAYAAGGYVAYQSTFASSANVVIRVPAAEYQQVLAQVEALGTVQALTSNSNDVRVQYTDLNATLVSLQTEQGALLRLLNESTSINSTLAIESQLQGVNQQINDVQSQILQTRTLISYSTIQVTVTESTQTVPLAMSLTATPKSGESPLSVTFNAVVKGGVMPYVVNYNFGDGSASQGQIVIHTYYQPGQYNVTVTATDQNGTSVEQWVMVHVTAPSGTAGLAGFLGTVSGLLVSVVEGIVEVAVVVLPIAGVAALVLFPLQRRSRNQKAAKQAQ